MRGFLEKTPTDVWDRLTHIAMTTLDHPQTLEAKTTEREIGTHTLPKPDIESPMHREVF
jgi:hypothetical protein